MRVHLDCIQKLCASCYSQGQVQDWVRRQNLQRYTSLIKQDNDFVVVTRKETVPSEPGQPSPLRDNCKDNASSSEPEPSSLNSARDQVDSRTGEPGVHVELEATATAIGSPPSPLSSRTREPGVHVELEATATAIGYPPSPLSSRTGEPGVHVELEATTAIGYPPSPLPSRAREPGVAANDDAVVAFGHMGNQIEEKMFSSWVDLQVFGFYVSPDHPRKGVGKMLFGELERRGLEQGGCGIGVVSTLNAIPFYKACQFKEVGTYYHGDSKLECTILERRL